jgi:hypothetical protein
VNSAVGRHVTVCARARLRKPCSRKRHPFYTSFTREVPRFRQLLPLPAAQLPFLKTGMNMRESIRQQDFEAAETDR